MRNTRYQSHSEKAYGWHGVMALSTFFWERFNKWAAFVLNGMSAQQALTVIPFLVKPWKL